MKADEKKQLLTRIGAALRKREYAQQLLGEAEEELVFCGRVLQALEAQSKDNAGITT